MGQGRANVPADGPHRSTPKPACASGANSPPANCPPRRAPTMSNIPEARVHWSTVATARSWPAVRAAGTPASTGLPERIGRQARCPDCDSVATIIVTDTEIHPTRHDPTCPAWLAFCAERNPDQHDVMWAPLPHARKENDTMSDDLPDWIMTRPAPPPGRPRPRDLQMYCRGDERFARGYFAFVEDCERDVSIPEAFHSFCKHFGDTAIGSQGLSRPWPARRRHRSPRRCTQEKPNDHHRRGRTTARPRRRRYGPEGLVIRVPTRRSAAGWKTPPRQPTANARGASPLRTRSHPNRTDLPEPTSAMSYPNS